MVGRETRAAERRCAPSLRAVLGAIWLAGAALAFAAEPPPPSSSFEWNLPLLDLPYNRAAVTVGPSLQQSLNLTKDVYQAVHRALQDRLEEDHPRALFAATIGFDVLATWLPFGNAWMHEEWHRAVMGEHDIRSYNGIYDFDLFSETIAVSHVKDEDLVRLKQESPQDLIRLHAAGLEAQNELSFLLEQDTFFLNTRTFDTAVLWLNYANNWAYIDTCASAEADKFTRDILNDEGTAIDERDFTGLDCTAWVYDLFRPDEPYAARGAHPSGVGIDRYIQWSDLSEEEQNYLNKQARLNLVNFANPFLFGRRRFAAHNPWGGEPLWWNATLRHQLTSFGYNIDVNLFLQSQMSSVLLIWHQYFNDARSFPGLELRVLRKPWRTATRTLPVTTRLAIWQQPRDGQFRTDEGDMGALAGVKVAWPLSAHWQAYVETEAKTPGWVAGNGYLDGNISVRLGVSLLLH